MPQPGNLLPLLLPVVIQITTVHCTVVICTVYTVLGLVLTSHKRRMGTEAKAKVVASIWGAKFVKFLAALAVLPRSIRKNRMNSTVSSTVIDRGKTASAVRN